jgi:predicted acyltransferase
MWDVILPAFMTIAGTALAYSFKKQLELGVPGGNHF